VKNLNNKGISLVELLISIVLISIVMMFMYKLLIDVNNEQTNDIFAKENQVNRTEILKLVETDFIDYQLISLIDQSTSSKLSLVWNFNDGKQSVLEAYKENDESKIYYKNALGKISRWTIKDGIINFQKAYVTNSYQNGVSSLMVNIEIYTTNNKNSSLMNNLLDDLTFSYIGLGQIRVLRNNANVGNNCLGTNC